MRGVHIDSLLILAAVSGIFVLAGTLAPLIVRGVGRALEALKEALRAARRKPPET
jgi:hypothetical protein